MDYDGGVPMEEKDNISKLEIAGFTNAEIRPEPKEIKTIAVNAHPGWYSETYNRARGAVRNVRSKLRFTKKGGDEEGRTIRSLMLKTGICAFIVLLLLLVKNIDSPFTNSVSAGVRDVLENNTDLEKEIGRLKFVQNLFGSEPVLSEITDSQYVYPVEGRVTKKFGEDNASGITIESTMNSPVLSVAACTVKKLSAEVGGTALRAELEDGTEVVYTGVVPRVEEGDNVKKGGILGTLKGNSLALGIYQSGKAVDPLAFLSKRGAEKE
jgi:murein DD-endopeptidase MepM/ murein hydrolase activator NlpD